MQAGKEERVCVTTSTSAWSSSVVEVAATLILLPQPSQNLFYQSTLPHPKLFATHPLSKMSKVAYAGINPVLPAHHRSLGRRVVRMVNYMLIHVHGPHPCDEVPLAFAEHKVCIAGATLVHLNLLGADDHTKSRRCRNHCSCALDYLQGRGSVAVGTDNICRGRIGCGQQAICQGLRRGVASGILGWV
jgi:hypothetical protein